MHNISVVYILPNFGYIHFLFVGELWIYTCSAPRAAIHNVGPAPARERAATTARRPILTAIVVCLLFFSIYASLISVNLAVRIKCTYCFLIMRHVRNVNLLWPDQSIISEHATLSTTPGSQYPHALSDLDGGWEAAATVLP